MQKLMNSEKFEPTLNQAINWIIEIRGLGRFMAIAVLRLVPGISVGS